MKRLFVFMLAIAILLVVAVVFINLHIRAFSKEFIYTDIDSIPSRYTVLVLGAGVRNDTPSHVFRERLDCGITLAEKGKAQKMLITGDHGRKHYDEVNTALNYIMKKTNFNPDYIFLDHAGFSTYESMYRARDVFQVDNAIIVTQDFHMFRSVYIARQLGIDAIGYCSKNPSYRFPMALRLKWYLRESLACLKTFLLIKTNAKPTYLGEPIPITGSGKGTQGV